VFNRCFHGSLLISRKNGCRFAPYAPAKPPHRPILVSFRDSQYGALDLWGVDGSLDERGQMDASAVVLA
jgi:hypothetical protein